MDSRIIIGTGSIGTSSVMIMDNISENKSCYWISKCVFGASLVVFKTTDEGKKITKLIEEKKSSTLMSNYLDNVVLKNINLAQVRAGLKYISETSYVRGQKNLQIDLKKLLNIE